MIKDYISCCSDLVDDDFDLDDMAIDFASGLGSNDYVSSNG